jgi:hypothetical protein
LKEPKRCNVYAADASFARSNTMLKRYAAMFIVKKREDFLLFTS